MTDEVVNEKVKELELKVHALEVEKRESKIRTHKADFKADGKSLDFLDGVIYAMENMKQHSVAEVVPKEKVYHARKLGDVIDEDAVPIKSGSDL